MSRILQLSDLHVVAPPARASGRLDTARLLTNAIDHLIERLPMLGPLDAVLVTGDVSDDGSLVSYQIVREQLERLSVPILMLPPDAPWQEDLADILSAAGRGRDLAVGPYSGWGSKPGGVVHPRHRSLCLDVRSHRGDSVGLHRGHSRQ